MLQIELTERVKHRTGDIAALLDGVDVHIHFQAALFHAFNGCAHDFAFHLVGTDRDAYLSSR